MTRKSQWIVCQKVTTVRALDCVSDRRWPPHPGLLYKAFAAVPTCSRPPTSTRRRPKPRLTTLRVNLSIELANNCYYFEERNAAFLPTSSSTIETEHVWHGDSRHASPAAALRRRAHREDDHCSAEGEVREQPEDDVRLLSPTHFTSS